MTYAQQQSHKVTKRETNEKKEIDSYNTYSEILGATCVCVYLATNEILYLTSSIIPTPIMCVVYRNVERVLPANTTSTRVL